MITIVKQMLRRPWSRVFVEQIDGGYSARVLEMPGCFADGETLVEANARLEDAMATWFELTIEKGDKIPEPQT